MNNRTETENIDRLATGLPDWRLFYGQSYSTGQLYEDVPDTNTKTLYLENPTEDTYYAITNVTVRATGGVKTWKAFNVTEDTQGNSVDTGVENKRSGSDNDSSAIARRGGDNETGVYSGGRELSRKSAGRGGTPTSIQPGIASDNQLANVVDPGDNMLVFVLVDTDGGGAVDASIDVDWIEIPEDDY